MIVMPLRPGGPREVPALGGWRFDEGEACIVGPVRDAESCMRLIRGGAGSGGRGRFARACDETGARPCGEDGVGGLPWRPAISLYPMSGGVARGGRLRQKLVGRITMREWRESFDGRPGRQREISLDLPAEALQIGFENG